jgi:hypothetical protein
MTNIRRRHTASFTVIANWPIEDAELDWETLGLLTYLRSRPDNWQVKVRQLVGIRKGGRDRMWRMLRQLEHRGYLKREISRSANGRIDGIEYIVSDDRVQGESNPPTAHVLAVHGKHVPIINTYREQNPSLKASPPSRSVDADQERELWREALGYWQSRRAAFSESRRESVRKARHAWGILTAQQRKRARSMMPQYFDALVKGGRTWACALATWLNDHFACDQDQPP